MESSVQSLASSGDVLFLLLGAVMVFAMHAGFAFLEVGTVRIKNQTNAFVKILTDWSVSTVVYFLVGYPIAYGIHFMMPAEELLGVTQGYELVRFFFLLCFAACIPAIISGGIAERTRFWPQVIAGAIFAGLTYPLFESFIWGQNSSSLQGFFESTFGAPFHDFAGSVVVHSMGGWLALPAVLILGPRMGRWVRGKSHPLPISNMAMVGGVLFALVAGKNDPGFTHNGALAGLIAICAASDIVHPIAAFFIGGIGSLLFVYGFQWEQNKLKIDDVLGVWPLHGLIGSWGGIAAGIFGGSMFGGLGGVTFLSQLAGTVMAIVYALVTGFVVYGAITKVIGFRLIDEDEFRGSDLTIHKITAYPEEYIS